MRRNDPAIRPAALAATTTLFALMAMASVALPAVVAARSSDAVVMVAARHLLASARVHAAPSSEPAPSDLVSVVIERSAPDAPSAARRLAEHLLDIPPPTA